METASNLDKQEVNLQTVAIREFRTLYTTYDPQDLGRRKLVL